MIATTDGICIDNIGPIEHLELDARPGTITVLRGMNGEGKSTVLDAIDAITRGSGKLESRDGTTGGRAVGFGVTIKVGRGGANRRLGDLVVTAVEDRLSIADFVDPAVKDPFAADGRRLKALASLAGVAADPAMFHSLAGGPEAFAEIVKPESLEATDPIILAEKIKRDFEAASRIQTTRAERLFGEVKAKLAANDGLDMNAEHDAEVLQRRLEIALAEQSALDERQRAAGQAALKRQNAQSELDKAARTHEGPTLAEAEHRAKLATDALEGMEGLKANTSKAVDRLREELRAAESQLERDAERVQTAKGDLSAALEVVELVKRHDATLAAWRQTLADSQTVNAPSDDVVNDARSQVMAARQANERGVLIRAAMQRATEAEKLEADRAAAVTRAEFLREAAKSVLDVLAESVKGLVPGLKLDPELRIIVPHPKRGQCFYADLSHGERWTMALDIAVAAFERRGERGVLAIPQEAWEGLDGRNRRLVADHVASTSLIVFTAEAERSTDSTAGGIAVEVLAGGVS